MESTIASFNSYEILSSNKCQIVPSHKQMFIWIPYIDVNVTHFSQNEWFHSQQKVKYGHSGL